ncbi:DNA translocase FtsK [Cellvibrio japonicus]|uniref:DNA translocase FtsK n=1 Tax=Cellvibrio japonicus (strain Ueda107) TaxID=498211 RepID=B3PL42_CELJU|nr:DNA translocase FtsK [Cellvibrio japonicus]ACE84669.1 DNA translocase ftsK [Cellvibrio japonicus Ueda107]QEI12930.1 cell division protein FtsK [Cellvibrio japonicus]QEI16504.1 cell division protein FtsK [Cellvibrio japonicus]QEI20082.1 cell division protein FtsK [Cellvibrio japonicus]
MKPNASRKAPAPEHTSNLLVRLLKEGALIGLGALCLYLLLAMVTYDPTDPGWSHTGDDDLVENAGGPFGAWLADVFFLLFGYIAYLFPVMIAYRAWLVLRDRTGQREFDGLFLGLRIVGLVLVMVSATAIATMHYSSGSFVLPNSNGGLLGAHMAEWVNGAFSYTGGTLLMLALFLVGMTIFTDLSWLKLMEDMGRWTLIGLAKVREKWQLYQRERQEKLIAVKAQEHRREVVEQHARVEAKRVAPVIIAEPPRKKPVPSPRVEKEKQPSLFESLEPAVGQLPPISLLDPADKRSEKGYSKESLEAMSRMLELKLKDFGIDIEVVSVQPGPVVTRFEIQPAPGIKASRISGLAKDLARSLAVVSVRVVEVIPGKSVMGVEIPNAHREIVRLSEVIASEQYDNAKSPLTMALGHDIAGQPVVADLAKMPHLLVAGTTGSGKSVGVNVMLLSLLYKSTPQDVRLILVDPKMLELSVYEGIPHLLTPVITDMKDAANGLRWCVGEMERRYKLMAALGVRNLAGFNRKIDDANKAGEPIPDPLFKPEENYEAGAEEATPPRLETLPAIVVVIDEFADMMMIVDKKKVEQLIARIAQKARAAGIHLILATQRPSVDIITGLIKANVPTRMAFQVSSKIDSRTILDQGGAEQLLGHGDMLYLPSGTSVPIRVHGAFVDDHEVHRVVADWKKRGEPQYIDGITDDDNNSIPVPGLASEGGEDGDGEADALYDEAVQFVIESRKASISAVQRKLRIGYNRAARLIETMESAGVVSSAGHNGNREVLVGGGH